MEKEAVKDASGIEEDNQNYQSEINDYQDAVTGINSYQMTSAILYDLANRSNSLPIYDSRMYVGKSMIPNPRLKKRHNRSKMSSWEEEEERFPDQHIRIDSQMMPLNTKLSKNCNLL